MGCYSPSRHCRFTGVRLQGARHLPVAFEVELWAVGLLRSLGPWLGGSPGLPCLAVAPFNLGTVWWCWCYLGVASGTSTMTSV